MPAPTQQVWDRDDELKAKRVGSALVVSQTSVPPYGQRKGWVPRAEEDFGGNHLSFYSTNLLHTPFIHSECKKKC